MNRKMRRAGQKGVRARAASRSRADEAAFTAAFVQEGWRLLAEGRDAEAMETAKRVVRSQETDETRALFSECVKRWSYFPGAEDLRDLLVRALREPWVMPAELAGITRGLMGHDPILAPAIARAAAAWPRRASLEEISGAQGFDVVAANDLLLAMLETGKISGIDLERFLTTVRAGLLDLAIGSASHAGDVVVRYCCALARQSIINEYVFDLTTNELDRVGRLHDELVQALADHRPIAPLAVAIVACYRPLGSGTLKDLAAGPWPRSVADILAEMTREHGVVRRHSAAIQALTAIRDDTSLMVAQQYEQNPYPRWVALPKRMRQLPIDDWFRSEFPSSGYRPIGKTKNLDMLIAGCGTGHHSTLFAQSFPEPRVLAIDLSLASLCYAREKSRELGLDIEYAQADILELGSLQRSFDVISASGVLHHLADPEKGWQVLLSLLRRDGFMHIGLYSEMAGRSIASARAWLDARGFGSTPDDIRRARQALADAAVDDPTLADVLRYPDFYATSECRDLLFHVQEHRTTLPRIKAFLDRNGLRFLGFNVVGDVLADFRRSHPGGSETDLSLWHAFEQARPDIFRGMYQFWVQRF